MTKSRILRWEIISDYPDEPNVITKILIGGRQEGQSEEVTWEEE